MKKVKKGPESGVTVNKVIANVSKKFGKNAITSPSTYVKRMAPRLPTGNYALTLATGGGYPIHCMSRIKGPPSGGKTTNSVDALKMAGMICWRCMNIAKYCTCKEEPLKLKSLYVNAEGTLDLDWVSQVGVDPDSYYISESRDGDEHLAMVDAFLAADDSGLVIIDSVAQLMPPDVVDRAIGDYKVGAHAKLMTDARWHLTGRLSKERGRGHPCMILCTNQIRKDIGVMFGDNETETGGNAFRHWLTLGLRVQKLSYKNPKFMDQTRSLPLAQKHGFRIDKRHIWVNSQAGEYIRAIDDVYSLKDPSRMLYRKGQIVDFDLITEHLDTLGLLDGVDGDKLTTQWGGKSKSKRGFTEMLKKNEELYYQLHIELTKAERAKWVAKNALG